MFNCLIRPRATAGALAVSILFTASFVQARENLDNLSFFPRLLPRETVVPVVIPDDPDAVLSGISGNTVPGIDTDNDSAIALYQGQIAVIETNAGPYDASLVQPLQSLAGLYQARGDLPAAIGILDRQLQLTRVNHGLYSTAQSDVLRALINTYVEAGDLENAHLYHEALFNLEMRAYGRDSLEFVASRLEWADWNMNHYLSLGTPPAYITGRSLADPRITVAYDNYLAALDVLEHYSLFADERMITTEKKLAALNFIVNRSIGGITESSLAGSAGWQPVQGQQNPIEQANAAHFFNGSSALKRAIAYSASVPQPDYDFIAQRMLELGDWYLLFDRKAAAIDVYNDALEVLAAAKIPQAEIDRILSSGLPVQTPDLTWQKQVSSDQYAGFIDVEFDLSKYGTASNPQILSSSGQDSRIEKELIRTIRSCKFRPMFAGGAAVDNEKVKLRYYYTL